MAALVGVLVFDTLPGLFIGIGVSVLLLLYRASRPNIAVLGRVPGPDGPYEPISNGTPITAPFPGLVVMRVESRALLRQRRRGARRASAEGGARTQCRRARRRETIPPLTSRAASMLNRARGATSERAGDQARPRPQHRGQVREPAPRSRHGQSGPLPAYPTVQDAVAALTKTGSG